MTQSIPPVRACIFDVDGLLINSEDIYTEAYNNVLHEYNKPDLPWSIKARLQSGGRRVGLAAKQDQSKVQRESNAWMSG
jgi:pseudouridine-5'-monophosphatase